MRISAHKLVINANFLIYSMCTCVLVSDIDSLAAKLIDLEKKIFEVESKCLL